MAFTHASGIVLAASSILSVTACYIHSCISLVRADSICQFFCLKTTFALLEAASKIWWWATMTRLDVSRCFLFFFHVILKWAFQRKSLLRNVRTTSNTRAMLRPRSVQLACSLQVFAPGRHNLSKASKSRKTDFSDSFLLFLICFALIGMNWSSLKIYLSSMCWGVAISLPLRCCRQCGQTRREWLILELCMTRNSHYNLEIAYDLSPDIRYPLPLRSRPRCRQKLARLALCLAESWSFGATDK